MKRGELFSALGVLAFTVCLSAPVSGAERSCTSLKNAAFKGPRIESAEQIGLSPAWTFPPSLFDRLP